MPRRRPHPKPKINSPRQRGTVYILVLSVTAMLAAVGVTAVMAGRVQVQAAALEEDQVQARVMAQSSVDLRCKALNNQPTWRTQYTSGTWYGPNDMGAGQMRFKLIDEGDSNLADDANDPARLYIEATVGGAVRIYSTSLVVTNTKLVVDPTTLRRELAN